MSKNLKLLLTETVEALGIVGDVVNVRTGYARNYLLPRNMATTPTDEATHQRIVEALAAALGDSGRQVRSAAARALGNLQEPQRAQSALPALQQLAAHDPERRVRSAAESTVKAIREGRQAPVELSDLRKELEAAVEHNKELESRLEKLEQLRKDDAAPAGESAGASASPRETTGE